MIRLVIRRISILALTGVLAVALGAVSAYAWLAEDDEAQQPAVDAAAADQVDQVEAGRQLFQTKGCAACHDIWAGDMTSGFSTGPDLSLLSEEAGTRVKGMTAAEYVRVSIAAPDAYLLPGYGYYSPDGFFAMPTLPLTPSEIDVLTEFLLAQKPDAD